MRTPLPTAGRHVARAGVVAAVIAALLLAGGPGSARTVDISDREPVFDGLVHERITVRLGDGSVARGNVLRMDRDADSLELRPVQAQGRITGRESIPSMARREFPAGALAGTNGGWHLWRTDGPAGPIGAPNGFSVLDGRVQGAQALLAGGATRARSAFGIRSGGEMLVDLLDPEVTVEVGGEARRTKELNRVMHEDAVEQGTGPERGLFVLDSQLGEQFAFGDRFDDLEAIELPDLPLAPGETAVGTVDRRLDDPRMLPADGTTTIATYGSRYGELAGVGQGDEVAITVDPNPVEGTPGWDDVVHAVPAVGLVENGQVRADALLSAEGFRLGLTGIISSRHPRTAVGFNDDELLLVTIDGRADNHSAGMTLQELGRTMIELGAREAANLDGGGSTTMTIDTAVANRVSDASPRSVSDGLFVYTDYTFDASRRLAGADRYATAAAVARDGFAGGAETAVLATGEAFPDALAGGALAAAGGHPLLLTRSDGLPEPTAAALAELGVTRAVVLGGTNAVSDEVATALESRGITVERLAGDDRYATAAEAAADAADTAEVEAPDGVRRAFVAAGRDFPDALAASSPAGQLAAPVLLTEADELPAATRAWLESADLDEVVVVGGTAAVSAQVAAEVEAVSGAGVERLAGPERFATAAAINRWAAERLDGLDASGIVVAQGRAFPDALAGGPLAAARDQLLMIVPPRDIDDAAEARTYLDERAGGLSEVVLLGGTAALSSYQHWQLDQLALP